jgi:hypothetical protein
MQKQSKRDHEVWTWSRRLATAALLVGAGAVSTACNPHPLKGVSTSHSAAGTSNVAIEVDRKVDILLVIDDSGSMAEEQAKLAANFGPFIEKLDAAGADYRIAVTTSDADGPNCMASSENGSFVATSCLDRPQDFIDGGEDAFELACAANCSLTTEELGILPTALEVGGELRARPWIESYSGISNLAPGVTALEAFQCLAPQGISGCGYERQLESMALGLRRSATAEEDQQGFLRPGANLMVIIVTDEADCSFNVDYEFDLFSIDGDQLFFESGVGYSTSAVCWNAGVRCEGSPEGYDSCRAVDLGANAAPTDEPDAAVLHPASSYVAELAELGQGRDVMVSIIAGVPQGYADGSAELIYAEPEDATVARDFGIDYGCTSGSGDTFQYALPPVRLLEFAEAFAGDAPNVFSVCSDDYTPALTQIVDSLLAEFGPACFEECVLDTDAEVPGVQPNCKIIERISAQEQRYLPACEFDGEGFVLPSEADACWIAHNDAEGLTATTADDLAPECRVPGQNLQFELIRRPGVPVAGGTEVRAECELSAFESIDCPE